MLLSRNIFGIQSFFSRFNTQDTLFKQVFLNSPTALTVTDENGVIQYVNNAFTDLTGYHAHELIGNNYAMLKSFKNEPHFFKYFWEKLLSQNSFCGNIWNQHKNAEHILHCVTITSITLDKNYYLTTHIDVTREIELQERHHYLAYHDPHTGLANRSLFDDRLSHAINSASRMGHSIGILFCDLNEFKQINDEHGHAIGDEVLKEVAQRLSSFFRSNDTVARFGGDEFVIIVEHLEDDDQLSRMAQSLALKIAEPMSELNLSVSACIGSASFPQDGLTKDQLLRIADAKMYDNKNRFYGLIG